MAESKAIIFNFKEIAEALVKKQGIHEGIWGIYVEFGISAANINASDDPDKQKTLLPAAIIPVLKFGIQPFADETNLSVDASKVNPVPTASKKKAKAK